MKLELDHTHLMSPNVGSHGIHPEALSAQASARERAVESVLHRAPDAGDLGFLALPEATQHVNAVEGFLEGLTSQPKALLVLGIGGSSLGPRALTDALGPDRTSAAIGTVHYVDNADPMALRRTLAQLDPATTLVNVISKSGSTVETLAARDKVLEWLAAAPGPIADRLVYTTDPENGFLRAEAHRQGVPTLCIPPNVGGRFSVFTAVGLLAARFAGLDGVALLEGARNALDDVRTLRGESLAACSAGLHHLLTVEAGLPMSVWMPYASGLATVGDWFVQLWSESLGKRGAQAPTPLRAVGATDQHSQLQLWMDGPRDKHIWFLEMTSFGQETPMQGRDTTGSTTGHLRGKTLTELLHAERRATALALAQAGVPNATLHMPLLDELHLGHLLMTLQLQTAIAGDLWEIDAFDQPGVEAGKRFIHGLMGREDHAQERIRLETAEANMTSFKCP